VIQVKTTGVWGRQWQRLGSIHQLSQPDTVLHSCYVHIYPILYVINLGTVPAFIIINMGLDNVFVHYPGSKLGSLHWKASDNLPALTGQDLSFVKYSPIWQHLTNTKGNEYVGFANRANANSVNTFNVTSTNMSIYLPPPTLQFLYSFWGVKHRTQSALNIYFRLLLFTNCHYSHWLPDTLPTSRCSKCLSANYTVLF
jgi:hypothetical protein